MMKLQSAAVARGDAGDGGTLPLYYLSPLQQNAQTSLAVLVPLPLLNGFSTRISAF